MMNVCALDLLSLRRGQRANPATHILALWDGERQVVIFFERRLPASGKVLVFSRRNRQVIHTETGSIWNSDGRAGSGPLEGTRLRALPGVPSFGSPGWHSIRTRNSLLVDPPKGSISRTVRNFFAVFVAPGAIIQTGSPDEATLFCESFAVPIVNDAGTGGLGWDMPEAVLRVKVNWLNRTMKSPPICKRWRCLDRD